MPPQTNRKSKKPKSGGDLAARIDVNGTVYTVVADAVENATDMELYLQSGGALTWGKVLTLLRSPGGHPPPFAIAGFVFVAQRQANDPDAKSYRELLDSISYDDVMTGKVKEVAAPEGEESGPQA